MEEHQIITEYAKYSRERGSRSELTYRAFKGMAENEEFLRAVADKIAERAKISRYAARNHMW